MQIMHQRTPQALLMTLVAGAGITHLYSLRAVQWPALHLVASGCLWCSQQKLQPKYQRRSLFQPAVLSQLPHPSGRKLRCVLHWLPELPGSFSPFYPQSHLLDHTPCMPHLSSSLPHLCSLAFLPNKLLAVNPCLRLCFWGNPHENNTDLGLCFLLICLLSIHHMKILTCHTLGSSKRRCQSF